MAMPLETLAVIAFIALAFLAMGWMFGSRLGSSKAAQGIAEMQTSLKAKQVELDSELALVRQREAQLQVELNAAADTHRQALQQLEELRSSSSRLGIELSATQARLAAETEKGQEKSHALDARAQQSAEQNARYEELQKQFSALRELLGTSQEQVTQLSEVKAAYASLQARYEQTQRELQQQREQLGQSGEQASQLVELKDKNGQLEQRLRDAEEVLKNQRELLGQASEQRQQLEELRGKLQASEQELAGLRSNLSATQASLAEVMTARDKEQQAAEEKLQLLQENKEQLKQEFQNLANQIFDSKQQSFSEQSRQGLDVLLKPFKDQLESFRHRVDQVHSETINGQSTMKSELGKLMELNAQITTEASNLTKALKGDKKLQGTWGEQKVELLLEQAGLRKGIEYLREASFKNDDDDKGRPDFVVQLPEGKHIIIDSKVSLVAYTDYVAAETDEQRTAALAAHVLALRNHVQSLAGKKYPELAGMNSPDFVFLFMPVEPAYLVAAEHSPALFQLAYEQRIAIVTATTLLPVLRVVANLWSIQRQNQSTLQLAQQASRVYDKLRVFVEKMEKLGNQISTLQKTYNESFNTLAGSHGSLTKTVDKFVDLGVKVVKRLPAAVSGAAEEAANESELLAIEEGGE